MSLMKDVANDINSDPDSPFTMSLACCEMVLLNEIAQKECTINDIAQTYRLAMIAQRENGEVIDWKKVNAAIMERWSMSALVWIKEQAWSGKCFAPNPSKAKGGPA